MQSKVLLGNDNYLTVRLGVKGVEGMRRFVTPRSCRSRSNNNRPLDLLFGTIDRIGSSVWIANGSTSGNITTRNKRSLRHLRSLLSSWSCGTLCTVKIRYIRLANNRNRNV